MGFQVQLHILYPRAGAISVPGPVTWEPYEMISFGRITRVEKLTDEEGFGHLSWDSHMRAGVGVFSIWFTHLYARLDGEDFRAVLAPPFRASLPCFDGAEALLEGDAPWVEAVPAGACDPVDRAASLVKHNKLLALSDDELREHLRLNLIILHPPFIWAECAELAGWLTEAESRLDAAWLELEKDQVSMALARAWQAYLSHVGSVGARALFVFR